MSQSFLNTKRVTRVESSLAQTPYVEGQTYFNYEDNIFYKDRDRQRIALSEVVVIRETRGGWDPLKLFPNIAGALLIVLLAAGSFEEYIVREDGALMQTASGTSTVHNTLVGRALADSHPATAISFAAAGGMAGGTVQTTLQHLSDNKLPLDGTKAMTGDLKLGAAWELRHGGIENIFRITNMESSTPNDVIIITPNAGGGDVRIKGKTVIDDIDLDGGVWN